MDVPRHQGDWCWRPKVGEGTPLSVQDVCASTFNMTRGDSDVPETANHRQLLEGVESSTETDLDTVKVAFGLHEPQVRGSK